MKVYLIKHMRNARFLNSGGFTMLEMLFAFSIFLMLVSFLPLSFNYLFQDWKFNARTQRLEWLIFINQMKKEVRLADDADISNGRIVLRKAEQTIVYEKYGTNLRRRVDLKGHEIVLQQVESVSFIAINGGLEITLKDTFNQAYSASIYHYIDWEVSNVP